MGTIRAFLTAVQVMWKPSEAPRCVTRLCSVRIDMGPWRTGEGKSQSTSTSEAKLRVGAKCEEFPVPTLSTGRIRGTLALSSGPVASSEGANASDTSSPGRIPPRLSMSMMNRVCESEHACLSNANSPSVAGSRGAGRGACTIPAVISIPSILSNTARSAQRCRRSEAFSAAGNTPRNKPACGSDHLHTAHNQLANQSRIHLTRPQSRHPSAHRTHARHVQTPSCSSP